MSLELNKFKLKLSNFELGISLVFNVGQQNKQNILARQKLIPCSCNRFCIHTKCYFLELQDGAFLFLYFLLLSYKNTIQSNIDFYYFFKDLPDKHKTYFLNYRYLSSTIFLAYSIA